MLSRRDQELHGLCRAVSSLRNIKRCMVSVIEMMEEMRLSKVSHSTTNHIKRPISGKLLREKRTNQRRVFGTTCDAECCKATHSVCFGFVSCNRDNGGNQDVVTAHKAKKN